MARRVRNILEELDVTGGRMLHLKPDAFTHLGINAGNPWGFKPSIYRR